MITPYSSFVYVYFVEQSQVPLSFFQPWDPPTLPHRILSFAEAASSQRFVPLPILLGKVLVLRDNTSEWEATTRWSRSVLLGIFRLEAFLRKAGLLLSSEDLLPLLHYVAFCSCAVIWHRLAGTVGQESFDFLELGLLRDRPDGLCCHCCYRLLIARGFLRIYFFFLNFQDGLILADCCYLRKWYRFVPVP